MIYSFSQNELDLKYICTLDLAGVGCSNSKSNIRLKVMKLQFILYARTTRSPFRYYWNDFNADVLEFLYLFCTAVADRIY